MEAYNVHVGMNILGVHIAWEYGICMYTQFMIRNNIKKYIRAYIEMQLASLVKKLIHRTEEVKKLTDEEFGGCSADIYMHYEMTL